MLDRQLASKGADLPELLTRVGNGDRRAFGILYTRTRAKMLQTALRILHDREDAEDAVQDAFLKVWRRASTYRLVEDYSPISWMAAIARNSAIDRLRLRRDAGEPVSDDHSDDRLNPEECAIILDRDKQVGRLLAQLDERKRSIIVGAYVNGQSYQTLAIELATPINTIRTRLRRGLRELRDFALSDGRDVL